MKCGEYSVGYEGAGTDDDQEEVDDEMHSTAGSGSTRTTDYIRLLSKDKIGAKHRCQYGRYDRL